MIARLSIAALSFSAMVVSGTAFADTPVERGSYLVNTIMTCGNCHSPKGPPNAVAGKDFSGGLRFNEPPFDVTSPNITPDKDTGIGTWSAADIKNLMLDNVLPNGAPAASSAVMRSSSRSPETKISTSPQPASSRRCLTQMLSAVKSPLSNRTPRGLRARASTFSMAERTS